MHPDDTLVEEVAAIIGEYDMELPGASQSAARHAIRCVSNWIRKNKGDVTVANWIEGQTYF